MAYDKVKTEHNGAKNGGGGWGGRERIKKASKKRRRRADKEYAATCICYDCAPDSTDMDLLRSLLSVERGLNGQG